MSAINGLGAGGGIQQIMAMRQQLIDKSQVLQQLHTPESTQAASQPEGPAGGFSNALQSALENVSNTQNKAEDITAAYERGDVTDVAKVMLARQEAGVAFEATLQVRNRLLSAYQDIMRMGA
jgi:flagellar hook-basal body complex protein FliE